MDIEEEKEGKGGRPIHVPTEKTRAEVSALSTYGVSHREISVYVGLDPKTLRKYYREELDHSHMIANAKVGGFLFRSASGLTLEEGANHADCVRAAMFWAKTRMGWRETNQVDHTSSDGSMTPSNVNDAVITALENKYGK